MHRIEVNVQTSEKTTIQATAEEEAARAAYLADLPARKALVIRVERDRLLRLSDHTQLDDAPQNKVGWRVYREELRDIPNQPGFPDTVTWPTEP